MALDPQIALDVKVPTPQNPIETMTQIESVKALRDQREALAEQRQQQAQKLIQDAQDTAAMNAAYSQANGDPMVAGDILTKAGKGGLGQKAYAAALDHRQKMVAALKSENDLSQAHLDMALKIAGSMGDSPAHYQAGWQAIKSTLGDDPTLQQWFQQTAPQNPDPQHIPDIVNSLTKVGEDAKSRAAQQATNVENFLKGDYHKSLSSQLLSTPKEQRGQILTTAVQMAPSTEVRQALLQQFAPILGDDDAIAKAGKTPHEQAEEAATKSKAEQDAADKAAQLKIAQQNADANTFRAHNPASTLAPTLAPGAEPNDSVKQYADDLVNGRIAITGVPAAGGMRNQVEAYMRQQHFDLSKPLTAQVQARVEFAGAVLPQIEAVKQMAQEIDKQGLMGTVGGRFRDLASGESSAADLAGLTPEQRALVGKFVTQADLLSSGVAMTHFGARTSGDAVKAMRDRLDPKGKDLQTYLGSLDGARDVLNGYANLTPGKKGGSSSGGYTGEVRQASDGRFLGMVDGKVVELTKQGSGWVVK